MKKIWLLLGLLVMVLFVVSCAPVNDKEATGDLTAAEKAQLPVDLKQGETALAGKAIDTGNCIDPDSTSTFDKNSLLTKSKTAYASGSFEDKCYTWNKGTPTEKTRLIEGTCKNSKFIYWYAPCGDYLGKGAECVEGKCLPAVVEVAKQTIELKSITDKRYQLNWYDGDNNKVQMPFVYMDAQNQLSLAEDVDKKLILKENVPIQKNDIFVLSSGSKSYLLQYKGADSTGKTSPKIKFKNVGSGDTLEYSVATGTDLVATVKVGGYSFIVNNASTTSVDDFKLYVDLWGDGTIGGNPNIDIRDHGTQIQIVDKLDQNEVTLFLLPSDAGQLEVKITSNLETQKVSAVFMGGCEFTKTSADGLSKGCAISDTETLTWKIPTPEEFIYNHPVS